VQGSGDETRVTRRTLIAGASAVAAAGTLAATPVAGARASARRGGARRHADVIVVGAGASGSAAAHAVAKAGRSVLVLEARDRVGGRTLNHELGRAYPGKIAEIGGTFVGPTQDHMYALLKEFGLGTFPTYDKGETVSVFDGHHGRFSNSNQASFVNMGATIAVDLAKAFLQLDQMASTIPVGAPWKAPDAAAWDSQTLDTWAQANLASDSGRKALAALSNAIWGTEPRDMSLLYTAWYIAAAGDEANQGTIERLITTTGGAQQDRVSGGSQRLWLTIAADLGKRNVALNAPVTTITQTATGVRVLSDRGTFTAQRVIVAVPPALTARIRFDPQLPALRDQLVQRYPMGSYAKFEAVYDHPFWRDDGTNGQAFGDLPVNATFDQSPPDGKPGVMAGFIGGQYARIWDQQDDATRRSMVLQSLAQYFGPRMLRPLDYVEGRWTNELWSRGDPVGFAPPGVLLGFGLALRAPVGRIHWACTETADYWIGYMDGAVRSGQRAAAEALAQL
jgi:monoamine oxidase